MIASDQPVAALVLAKALVPEGFDDYFTQIEHTLDDTRFLALTKRCWDAEAWEPDDPESRNWRPPCPRVLLAIPTCLQPGPTPPPGAG